MLKKILLGAVVIFAVLMIFGFYQSNTPEGKAQSSERRSIEMCWAMQGKKSLDPSAARFAALACEKMEDDFRKKWRMNP